MENKLFSMLEEISAMGRKNSSGEGALVKEHLCFFLRAALMTYGSSQARGQNESHSCCHSQRNTGCEPCLRPTPQLMATLGPEPTE